MESEVEEGGAVVVATAFAEMNRLGVPMVVVGAKAATEAGAVNAAARSAAMMAAGTDGFIDIEFVI